MASNTSSSNAAPLHSSAQAMNTKKVRNCDDSFMKYLQPLCSNECVKNMDFRYCLETEFNNIHKNIKNNLE